MLSYQSCFQNCIILPGFPIALPLTGVTMLVWVGTLVGVILGVAHAAYVYRVTANAGSAGTPPDQARGINFAIWTVLLWILLGSYVVVLWAAGAVLWLVFKAIR